MTENENPKTISKHEKTNAKNLDHTFLECLIKINQIPRYVDMNSLESLERELLDENSFLEAISKIV